MTYAFSKKYLAIKIVFMRWKNVLFDGEIDHFRQKYGISKQKCSYLEL